MSGFDKIGEQFSKEMVAKSQQKKLLLRLERALDCGPVAAARALEVPYTTYKEWRSGRRNMLTYVVKYVKLYMSHVPGRGN